MDKKRHGLQISGRMKLRHKHSKDPYVLAQLSRRFIAAIFF